MEDKFIPLGLYAHGAAIFFSHLMDIGQACPFFERAFPMKAVPDFHHQEIPLDTPGYMDIFLHPGIQAFYCLDSIVQGI